jgi:hypothetical protein
MRKVFLLLGLLAVASLTGGCGGDDKSSAEKSDAQKTAAKKLKDPFPDRHFFHMYADADRYAGAPPLKINFKAQAYRASGPVSYSWRFDDGTTSREQNPTHTFKQAGTYRVIVDAKEEQKKKLNDRWNLVVGVWPKKVWNAKGEPGTLSKENIAKLQRDQKRRTNRRIRQLKAAGLPVSDRFFGR